MLPNLICRRRPVGDSRKNVCECCPPDQNCRPMGYFVPSSDNSLFMHPKESEIAVRVKKYRWDGAWGVIIVPVRTKETWFWSLGEVTVNWSDLRRDEKNF